MKITSAMREATWQVVRGKSVLWGFQILSACVCANLLHYVDGDYVPTDAGRRVADEYDQKRARARQKRNAAARGRADALRSVGLTRTRSGAWE